MKQTGNKILSVWCSEVRRQTCDLIELMEMAQPLAHYYLFMEDDFRCCTHPIMRAHAMHSSILKSLQGLPCVGLNQAAVT